MHHRPLCLTLYIAAAIIAIGAWSLNANLKPRVAQQISSTGIWAQWQAEAAGLKPIEQKWEQALPPAAAMQDYLAVQRHLNMSQHHLGLDTTHFSVISIEPYSTPDGKNPGIIRICVGESTSDPVLHLTADSPETAANALAELGRRPDLSFTAAKLSHGQSAVLTLEKPCLMTRA